MRILQINCVYALGSTGKIVQDITNSCISRGDEVIVLYGRQGRDITPNVIKVSSEIEAKLHSLMSRLTGLDFGYSPLATKKVVKIIKTFNPDIVHLHCLNGHFINVFNLVEYLKQKSIPTVLTLHAEIMHTAGCEHAYECTKWIEECYDCNRIKGKLTHYFRDDARFAYKKMKRAFDAFPNLVVVGVSDWLTNRAKQSSIFRDCNAQFITIENGLDLKSFAPIPFNENPLRNRFEGYSPVILHVTPNFCHPLKGGMFVLELAKLHPEWVFVIVGYNGEEELPSNVITIHHTQSKEELSWYYNIATLTLLTSKRETFSMVCAESLACGTPIVGFKAGGPESVFVGEFAKFVEFGNMTALDNAMKTMIRENHVVDTSMIHERFTADRMADKYRILYKTILESKI